MMKSVTKEKVFHVLKLVLLAVTVTLVLLSLLGTVAHASGLVDDTVNADNLYSKYPLSNYQLDFYVDNSWSWLPWNWLDGIGKSVQYGLYCITNFVWTISLYLSNATGYVVQQAYKLNFINDMADSIGKSIQTLAGVTEHGFSSSGFYVGFLLIFNLGITIFIFLLTGIMLFSQILFIIYAMFLPVSFLLSMIPTYENMAKQAVVRVFNAIMTRAGITLIVTVAFSISSMFYNISTDYPFFMVAFLQIICFAGIYMKLGELMSMFSLNANDSQQIGRRIFRRPMVFMRHRARRMEHRIARAVGAGSVAGAVAGASVARAGKPATNQPPKKRENTSASMGSRVGSAVGAVMDTKNKVRDSASSLKENVKDLPTQAGYAVHSAKQKAKDNVSDFKRGVVEERENRQEQRTQKRNLHRENISQKKQELQKAQEARQTVHANGSATAGATRSHKRPVATPVPKTAQTDTVIKPDMKRPATSPVIKNAEIKAGKETVRTNIRQEQQVKSVARTNQPNVAETISNHKKSTVQKTQVNGKSARKTVTKHSEKGRKK